MIGRDRSAMRAQRLRGLALRLLTMCSAWRDESFVKARTLQRSSSRWLTAALQLVLARAAALRGRLQRDLCAVRHAVMRGGSALRSQSRVWLVSLTRAALRRSDAQRRDRLPRLDAPRARSSPSAGAPAARWRHGRVRRGGPPTLTWHYGLYSPAGLRDDERAPLVVLLHGCTQRGLRFAHASGWMDLADAARVRLLCPEQRRVANQHGCWNWFHSAAQSGQGEVGVITAMIDDVEATMGLDTSVIAAAGLSAGGAMSSLLAFHCARRFRAVIAVAAPTLPNAPRAETPGCAPLAIIHGTADTIVDPRCADSIQSRALDSLSRAGIEAEPGRVVADTESATVTDFRRRRRLLVRRIDLHGHGHTWTGGPGGHQYCEPSGPPLTALCHDFLRDVGVLA
jgi:poly(3-hydroxybutyrate) depolymerase